MKKDGQHLHKVLFGLFTLALFLPLLQSLFKPFDIEELSGAYENKSAAAAEWSTEAFLRGEFQEEVVKYWNARVGFKQSLIRLNNQFNYNLFDKTSVQDVISGKDGTFFPEQYIKSLLGTDYIGKDSLHLFLQRAKRVQIELAKRDKFFFLMISPGKASVHKEQIPDKYWKMFPTSLSNYETFIEEANKLDINFLDLREFVIQNKNKFGQRAFPKYGLHWSGNTVAHVSRELLEYIHRNSSYKVPELQLKDGIKTAKDYRFTDYDIAKSMNLMFHISGDTLHYPTVQFTNVQKNKPTFLGVGDSFIQSFYGFYPIMDSSFSSESQIWYYNKVISWPKDKGVRGIKTMWLDLRHEVNKSDIIVLEMTEENIRQKGYGFIEDLSHALFKEPIVLDSNSTLFKELNQDSITLLRARNLHQVLGYTEQQMKKALVQNQLRNEWLINFDFEQEVKKIMENMKVSPKWLEGMKKRAIQRNLTLEEVMRKDAEWMVRQKLAR